jgi:hypothetical protein
VIAEQLSYYTAGLLGKSKDEGILRDNSAQESQ